MASISLRSSRRSEGLTTRSSARNNVAVIGSNHNKQQQSNIGRKKRPRDSLDHDDHPGNAKRTRIAVEILSTPKTQPRPRSIVIQADTNAVVPKPTSLRAASESPASKRTQLQPQPPPRKPTNHHEKVVNGIKHELDRLHPSEADLKVDKRKLRSQEGTRFKSELSQYFPEYDEIIGNEPKEDRKLRAFVKF
jgi:hypothetical protein